MNTETGSEHSLSNILSQAYDKIQETPAETPKETSAVVEQASLPETETKTTETEPVKAVEVAAKAPEKVAEPAKVEAPDTWTAAAKAKFATLDPDIQKEILKREDDVKNGFSKYSEDRKYAQSLKEVISPYMAIIQAEGGTPATAVQSLLNTAYLLRTGTSQQKAQLLQQIARQYGVDMASAPQGDDAYVDPIVAETRNELGQLKSEMQRQQQMRISQEIEAFKSDPQNKHFAALAPTMGKLIQIGQAPSLRDAYEQAQWLVPNVRDILLAEKEQEKEAKQVEERKAAAAAAKKAAGTQISSKADVKGAAKPASLRESLERKFEEIQAA